MLRISNDFYVLELKLLSCSLILHFKRYNWIRSKVTSAPAEKNRVEGVYQNLTPDTG